MPKLHLPGYSNSIKGQFKIITYQIIQGFLLSHLVRSSPATHKSQRRLVSTKQGQSNEFPYLA